ncbi:MAG: PBP1A family penicillin-binding protein [candidate division WOR-3 bacterium]
MRELIKSSFILSLKLFGFSVIAGLILLAVFWFITPSPYIIEKFEPSLATEVYDRNDNLIYTFYLEKREAIKFSDIPRNVINAFVAVEDKRFFEHNGIDIVRLFKSILVDIMTLKPAQGASTITQQLARNMFLTPQKALVRKIKEMLLAVKIERTFSKQEIIEKYLNIIYFGNGIYGVQTASKYFFGKDIRNTNLAEAALLAAIPKSPKLFSPVNNFERAMRRQRLILKLMKESGFITQEEYEEAINTKITITTAKLTASGAIGPYFMDMVRNYVISKYGEDFLYKGGAKIYTTMDMNFQIKADSILPAMLEYLETTYKLKPAKKDYKKDNSTDKNTPYLQGALITMDPNTGEILALVGGRDRTESEFNRATQALRQPGSAFKPFVYLTAVDNGYYGTDKVNDAPIILYEGTPYEWRPDNFDNTYLGEITVRKALALSRNLATVDLILQVGPEAVAAYCKRAGFTTSIPPYPSIALGALSISPMELTTAYATIANYGKRVKPYFIRKIVNRGGVVIEENKPKVQQVFDSTSVYILINLMRSVFTEGTAVPAITAYGWDRPAAGKTGTTNDFRDTWFIGFTPDLLTSVWVGFDSVRTIFKNATGAAVALPIWTQYMKEITKDRPVFDFPVPPGITFAETCDESGLLASSNCPKTHVEPFKSGDEPHEICKLHTPSPVQEKLKKLREESLKH